MVQIPHSAPQKQRRMFYLGFRYMVGIGSDKNAASHCLFVVDNIHP